MRTNLVLPIVLLIVFALSRWPGLMPENFSAAYALAFCAGVFFRGRMAWWLPLALLLVSDLALNVYYQSKGIDCFTATVFLYMLGNYVGYVALIGLGRKFKPGSSFASLLAGGILGALAFYLVTNTLSWFVNPFGNPEYTKNLFGWMTALTKGTAGWPETWTFFRNTLLSGGLFAGLFVGAMKLAERREEAEEPAEAEADPAEAADEAKA